MKYIKLFEDFHGHTEYGYRDSKKDYQFALDSVRAAIQSGNFDELLTIITATKSTEIFEDFVFYFVDNVIGGHQIDVKHYYMLDSQNPDAATTYLANEIKMFYDKTRNVSLNKKRLKEIPIDLSYTSGVKSLELQNNDITMVSPLIFKNNKNISFLRLNNNFIRKIPKEIGNLTKLSFLHLDTNPISELPKEIGKCVNLIDLTIANTDIKTLPKELANCKKLISVWIGSNKITNLEEIKALMPNCKFDTNK